ncbi:type II/IV secretion system protein [Cryobacterium sp. TMT1-3]|uniref:Type II/IV secretion system protein n=1 Tax=Cryobacterium luteum TaxID=1424661 RepID=A0A1H8C1P1_9MICO|nr:MULTISPECIES: GspE/PulE family protein [Cryobacterium]TFB89210.1 type II/IV secretion system protein [Cryobacterium luteum]TFC27479.1 type II/IV secretion system protein [Cryobacterium sp. TMT1-3]SEM88769.1 type IV pilus assembly protein PilB [Cryobacterium luteum]
MTTLTEILILHGELPIEELDSLRAGNPADDRAVRALVDQGIISEVQFARARAEQLGLPFVQLIDFAVERAAVTLVTAALCSRHDVLPLSVSDGHLTLAMVDPGNVFALDDVREAAHLPVRPVVVERADLRAAIIRYYRVDDELTDLSTSLEQEQAPVTPVEFGAADSLDEAPIVRFVNVIVSQAIADRASDIHIEPGEHHVDVRYRIDGVLHEMHSAPKSTQNGVISRLKIMADIDIAERRKPQDGRMSVTHDGRKIDLRVATLPTVWGEKIVMRILDNSTTSLSLGDLNLLETNQAAYEKSYSKPYGMILVTGPTGSGKSTTLYTTVNTIARPQINVITVEDPVEYRMPGINQIQVNIKAGLTFASALRAILRCDPDVVLVGEIRDRETAQIAIEASLTGHLVLSTLHTNDAPSAITRLTEMGIEPFLVGSALDCVVAQRLARRLCDRCKKPAEHDAAYLASVNFVLERTLPVATLFQANGCQHCSNTGYRGRIAIHEVMIVSEEIERLAVARASSAEIGRVARTEGMISLRQDGWQKVQLGLTTIEEILRVVA